MIGIAEPSQNGNGCSHRANRRPGSLHGRLRAAAYHLLADLTRDGVELSAGFEVASVPGWSIVIEFVPGPDADHPELNDMEQAIVEALGAQCLTGEQVAPLAGYPFGSSFRAALAGLVRRGVLAKRRGGGYFRPGVCDTPLRTDQRS